MDIYTLKQQKERGSVSQVLFSKKASFKKKQFTDR